MMPSVSKVNPDLQRERNRGTFNIEELTNILDGGVEKTKERRELVITISRTLLERLQTLSFSFVQHKWMHSWLDRLPNVEFFVRDPIFKDEVPTEYLSYRERYQEAVRRSCLMFYKIKEWQDTKKTGMSADLFKSLVGGTIGSALMKDGTPFTLHFGLFVPTLLGQGTIKQQAHWIGRAWNCDILGTYAQTELGHGSNIRGLETTAHYDEKTEEFVLNSPTLTSYKWWSGGLGHTVNYAIVVAQLYTKNECKGIHLFIVQLRDEETHEPLPGIKIGEIGAKLGMNGANQGYLGFENVRIPREHMLMKNAQVLKV